jgi:hypothetical protein
MFPARWGLRALAITIGVWAVLEIAVGAGLYVKTGPQVEKLVAQLGSSASELYAAEIPRMTKVQKNFVVLEIVWLCAIVVCAATSVWKKANPTVSGIALGILVHVSVFLAFDIVAERRGAVYLAELERSAAP